MPDKDSITLNSIDTAVTKNNLLAKNGTIAKEDSVPDFSYDKTVYDKYFPAELRNYLKDSLSDWYIPDPEEWDNLWFQTYMNPDALVNFIRGDFNGDKKTDYAVLLKDKHKAVAAWAIQTDNNGFTKIKLEDCGIFNPHIQAALQIIEPGKLEYIDPESDDPPKPLMLQHPAIQVEYFETSATTYYWDKNKYKAVVTGD